MNETGVLDIVEWKKPTKILIEAESQTSVKMNVESFT